MEGQAKQTYDPVKPQQTFKAYIRNNTIDNTSDFYSQQHFQEIQHKIINLNLEQFFKADPNIALIPFVEDNYVFVDTEEALSQISRDIQQHAGAIGVDIEQTYLNSYQGYNCLIQISTSSKDYIIDAIKLHDLIPQFLKPIFEKEQIVKVFYASGSDLQWLNRDYGIFVVNFFDVHLAKIFVDKHQDNSLVGLLSQHCNYKLDRTEKKKFQVSDWRERPLSSGQLNYAALDSHYLVYLRNVLLEQIKTSKTEEAINIFFKEMQALSLRIYELKPFNAVSILDHFSKEIAACKQPVVKIEEGKLSREIKKKIFLTLCKLRDAIARDLDISPDQVCSLSNLFSLAMQANSILTKENVQTILAEEKSDADIFKDYVEVITENLQGNSLMEYDPALDNRDKVSDKETKKLLKRQLQENQFTLKKDLYENCKILAPDGQLLTYANRKKINWYLNKGLATLITEEPLTIQLKFEPAGRGVPDLGDVEVDNKLYTLKERVNRCVVCGQEQKLSRHHVVPMLYRQHLPESLKSHNTHDVLLLCFRCQEKASSEADRFKAEIAKRYGIPLEEAGKHQMIKFAVGNLQKAISTYTNHQDKMSEEKKVKVRTEIRDNFEIIRDNPNLSEEAKVQFETLKYKEDQTLDITQTFVDYFMKADNYKSLVTKKSNKDFKNEHGKLVVEKLEAAGEIKKFIDEWREEFLSAMDPQFLPHDWHVVLKAKAKQQSKQSEVIS